MKLNILHEIPKELLDIEPKQAHDLLGGPTIFHIKGKRDDALYLSTLLHANETTSFFMLQQLIKRYENKELPRDLIIFVGNTFAAAEGMRHLPGQMDYNRIWTQGNKAEHLLAQDVINYAKEQNIFASIDVHNNTGKNPHYACINMIEEPFLALASYFGENTVYFTYPDSVQSMAFSKFCTSVTIEAGLPGLPKGIEESLEFVDKVFNMDEIVSNPERDRNEVYHTLARIRVREEASVDFEDNPDSDADLSFVPNLDERNFELVHKGSRIGYAKDLKLIYVVDSKDNDITDQFFKLGDNGEIIVNRLFVPSMFTKDIYIMKEDCLGYVMELMTPFKY